MPGLSVLGLDFPGQYVLYLLDAQRVLQRCAIPVEHVEGIQHIAVFGRDDAGIDHVQPQLVQHRRDQGEQLVIGGCVDEDLRAAALRYRLDVDDTVLAVRPVGQQLGVAGDLLGGMAQEIFLAKPLPHVVGLRGG